MRPVWTAGVHRLLLAVVLLLVVILAGCSGAGRNDAADGSASGESRPASDAASSGGTPRADSADRPAEGEAGGRTSRIAGNPQAAPGQLTAGEWRDVERWEDWQNLLRSREGTDNRRYWAYYRFDRLVVRAEAGGQPVVDADVIVKDADGRLVWRTKTDMDGYAYAYARMFERDYPGVNMPEPAEDQGSMPTRDRGQYEEGVSRAQPGYDVEVRAGGESKIFSHVPIPREEPLVVTFEQRPEPSDAVDLMFVVDTTGSMQDEIDFLREELKDVINRARKGAGQLDIEVSVNFYRDRYDDYVIKPYPFTADIDEAVRRIAKEKAEGGGDYPEAVEQALTNAVSGHEWRRSARTRLLFLVGDAPPRNEPQIVDELHETTLEAAKLGIRIVPVASSGVDVNTEYLMRFLAAATGGTYVFLTDHSGIGNDHLEAAVGEFEVRPLNDLLVEIIRRYAGLPEENG
ncbi:VWA domain-containing protein [Thermobacillus sp.]|uniref:VWA domain-containing protein n=1 Tax=Thermobacillus sp. TaxID=2108467 RepID=UPI0025811184|nr:VWA domain-containing protein [Thermobacillus sp.]